MNKRIKNNLVAITVLVITIILVILALHTTLIGIQLSLLSSDVVEAEMKADWPGMRAGADSVYESVQEARNELYHSSNPYTRWISTMDNIIRIPLWIFLILSPYLFIKGVRAYNLSKRRKARV